MIDTTKQVVIAQGVQGSGDIPPIIGDIAAHISEQFELASEFGDFKNEEDEEVIELILKLYLSERFSEAVHVLRLVFSLIECDEATSLLSIIKGENGENVERQFIEAFAAASPRCRMNRIRVIVEGECIEEEN